VKSVLAALGTRRKAIAAVLGVAAELITQAVPQTNPENALVLHSVLAVITVWMVHATPNDPPIDSISEFVDDLVKGDQPKHAPVAPQG
jgi:hypothetical protein